MKAWLQNYWNVIFNERDWSWTVVLILYLILALTIRGWFIGPLVRRAKRLDPKYYGRIKKSYLGKSIWGWLALLVSGFFVIGIWQRPLTPPLSLQDLLFIGGAAVSLILAVVFHLVAFGMAALQTLQQVEANSKNI